MNISALFIHRPVATTLLSIGVILVGLVALYFLPISPLPHVDIPTIEVKAKLAGASPETMEASVTIPLERALGRISGITEMSSRSTQGKTRIVLRFELDRDINGAARDVQAALNVAQDQLPSGLEVRPSYNKVNPADEPVMILGLTSDTLTQSQMYDLASTVISQKISKLKGVGEVEITGSSLPAVRVELNPQALSQYGIALNSVRRAISLANSNRPQGVIEGIEHHWQIASNSQASSADDYKPVIVGYSENGTAVQLADVANVVDSVKDPHTAGSANGKPAVLIIIRRASSANIIKTVDSISRLLPKIKSTLPAALNVDVMMERTSTIRTSLHDAGYTLIFAVILVILVVFVFLRNIRASIVPLVAVPVSLIGTFAVMYLLDYTLNTLSLMALTIVVGFVVDDTIVVLENISRHIEAGVPPKKAALIGTKEVIPTVLSMTLVLIAVFIPMLFLGGYVGLFVREFAVTLTVAIAISFIVALTTAPMLSALFIKPVSPLQRHGFLYRCSEGAFDILQQGYRQSLQWVLHHSLLTLFILFITIFLNVYLFTVIPKGYFPEQDTGQISGRIYAEKSSSFKMMENYLTRFIEIIRADPAVENVVGYTGGGQSNRGSLFIMLKPSAERKANAKEIVARVGKQITEKVPGAGYKLTPIQYIRTGGHQSKGSSELTLLADGVDILRLWEPRIRQALAKLSELRDIDINDQTKGWQTILIVDHDAAARLGITPKQLDGMLHDAFSQSSVSIIYKAQNQYRVVMGLAAEFTQSPQILDKLYITRSNGEFVPLSLIAHYKQIQVPLRVKHFNQQASISISYNRASGVSRSEATHAIERALNDIVLPNSIHSGYQGAARAFKQLSDEQPVLFLAAIITLYIVLGMLYESFIHPFTILSTLPSAGVGALLALMLLKNDFNVIAMIGIFMLIGIVMKNAIMMVDFALNVQRKSNIKPEEAIFQACLLRFRPIMMTTFAALLAAIPLAIGQGDGAEMRQPLGIAIGGGLIMSQLLTLYTTPVVYLYLDRFSSWGRRIIRRPNFITPVVKDSTL